jgi:FtsP/CotA-like multicopper oxidase with cupredoxin domain
MPLPKPAANAPRAVINNNYIAAGTLKSNVLTLSLDVVRVAWRPETEKEPEVPVLAFRETGKEPQIPGPMIRVRQGTDVHLTLHNDADTAILVMGLRPGSGIETDSVQLPPKATREVRYRLNVPGTYMYFGSLGARTIDDRDWMEGQLNGALIVDPPGGSPPDHVFILSEFFYTYPDRPFEDVTVINGKGWPLTERLTLTQGDSVHFRVINAIAFQHPMHLHGFYYRIKARGMWNKDGPLAPEKQQLANTDLMNPGSTLTFSFVPTTPGNWIFHCHFAFHVDESASLTGSPKDSAEAMAFSHEQHQDGAAMQHSMHGLVLGLHVVPRPGYTKPVYENSREIRLLVQKRPNRLIGNSTAYGFVIQEGANVPAKDSVVLPGPVLELEKGKPVRINVVNNLDEPTGIHWHGLEIESFPDGVPNWSGMKDGSIFQPIKPGESFVAEFTPPRAGTFLYHSHLHELHQIESGMYGAIIVTDKPRDKTHDLVVIAGGGGPVVFKNLESPYALVNGRRFPPPLKLVAGETYRLRLVAIHPEWRISMTLRNDSTTARWRAIAKDGADLPPRQATERNATIVMGPGETADFEYKPMKAGEWRIDVQSVDPGWHIPLGVIVSAPVRK